MPAARRPRRYRDVPHERAAFIAFHAECDVLLRRAEALDAQQRALSAELAEVRTQLAELRVVMWPRIDNKDIVHGYRRTHRGGPPPIPPVAPNAHPLYGRHLRNAALAVLARDDRPMTLTEIHRQLHLNGYTIESRQPVQRLADCLGYETIKGRAKRTERGTYRIDELNPRERRKLSRLRVAA